MSYQYSRQAKQQGTSGSRTVTWLLEDGRRAEAEIQSSLAIEHQYSYLDGDRHDTGQVELISSFQLEVKVGGKTMAKTRSRIFDPPHPKARARGCSGMIGPIGLHPDVQARLEQSIRDLDLELETDEIRVYKADLSRRERQNEIDDDYLRSRMKNIQDAMTLRRRSF